VVQLSGEDYLHVLSEIKLTTKYLLKFSYKVVTKLNATFFTEYEFFVRVATGGDLLMLTLSGFLNNSGRRSGSRLKSEIYILRFRNSF